MMNIYKPYLINIYNAVLKPVVRFTCYRLSVIDYKLFGLAWMSSISSGEDTSAPASPAISERAGYRLLGRAWMSFKIFFGGRYLLTPSRLRKSFGGQARYLSNSAERSMKDSYLK